MVGIKKNFKFKKGNDSMKKYGEFNTMDELIAYNMPLMRADRELRKQRKKAMGIERVDFEEEMDEEKKKNVEELLALLYAMEHMSKEEVANLRRQCEEDLKEAKEAEKKRELEGNL